MDNKSANHASVSQSVRLTKRGLKRLKGLLLESTPNQFHLFLQEIRYGGNKRGVVLDKALVKTTDSQKGTHVLDGSGSRLLTDSIELTFLRDNALNW